MIVIKIFDQVGSFAENKDIARDIRTKEIVPALNKRERVILDFSRVEAATQSFMHALISDLIRKYGSNILDQIDFKSCDDKVKKIIMIVVEYMQESD